MTTKDPSKLVQTLLEAVRETKLHHQRESRRRRRRQFAIERHHRLEISQR